MRGAILSLVIITGLGFSIPASAQSEPIELTDRQAKRLSGKLCRTLSNFTVNEYEITIGQKLEEHLLKSSGIDKEQSNYEMKLAIFWNKNSDKVICRENFESTYPEQHFYSRVIRQNLPIRVFKDYLFSNPENLPIDPNVVSVNQYGIQETVLDYIDRVLSQPDAEERFNANQIREVRDIIENDFGGKRSRELQ